MKVRFGLGHFVGGVRECKIFFWLLLLLLVRSRDHELVDMELTVILNLMLAIDLLC
jgi:hypothetical protein